MVQRTCVYYWLSTFVTTEYNEQIRHHCSLLVVVEFYYLLARKLVERHLHHRYGTLYYLLTGGDDSRSLLATQHHSGNLRSISQIVDAGLYHLILCVAVWLCELHIKTKPTRLVQYDRIELITPERRPELIADLEKRLGVKVLKVDIGSVDFLRDMAMIRVTFVGEQPAMGEDLKLSKDQLKQF